MMENLYKHEPGRTSPKTHPEIGQTPHEGKAEAVISIQGRFLFETVGKLVAWQPVKEQVSGSKNGFLGCEEQRAAEDEAVGRLLPVLLSLCTSQLFLMTLLLFLHPSILASRCFAL